MTTPPNGTGKTAWLAILAFVLAFLGMAVGGASLRFLVVAYQHGGL